MIEEKNEDMSADMSNKTSKINLKPVQNDNDSSMETILARVNN